MIAYQPIHFRLDELVDPATMQLPGEQAWWVLDPRLLWTLDQIRERYGKPVTINTWRRGGSFSLRGFRPENAVVGAVHSQHRFGRAADFDVQNIAAEEVRQDILVHPQDAAFQYITCLETGIAWVHLDVRNWDHRQHGILLVKP